MSEPMQKTVFNEQRGPIGIPKVDVNCNKRPRSHSNHSARSAGSSHSSGSSNTFGDSSGSPTTGNLSPTPPSIAHSEEDMDFYFGLEKPNPFMAPPQAPVYRHEQHQQAPPTTTYNMAAEMYNHSGYPSVGMPPPHRFPPAPTMNHHHHPGYYTPYPPSSVPFAHVPTPYGPPATRTSHPHHHPVYPYAMQGMPTPGGYHELPTRRGPSTKRMTTAGHPPVVPAVHHHHHRANKRTTGPSHQGGMSVIPPSISSVATTTTSAAAAANVTTTTGQQQGHAFQREGSLRLQEFIPSASTEQRQAILNDLQRDLPQLSRTPYGNYVVQKLIQHGTPQQRLTIVQVLKHHFETLATDLYGHRVVSKALEYGDDTCKSIILGSLLSCFKDMVNDEHGNYVAQKCIKTLATYQCEAIWEKFFGRVWITATHKFGHCVLKTLFLYAPAEVKDRILAEMSKNVILLAKDPYGNYVLQHILDKEQYGDLLPRHNIIGSLLDQFDDLSCNKFASNVVEKCLRCTDTQMLDMIVYRFCATSNKKLGKLINNPFGNYVVKTLLNLCDAKQKERIRNRCVRIYQRIRCSCAVPAIFGECRMELERRFRERRPDVMDDDDEDDDDESDDDRSSAASSQRNGNM